MKTNIIVATISAIVAVVVWEGMHVVTGADEPKSEQSNTQFIWRNHV
jgi:hypothetical protein